MREKIKIDGLVYDTGSGKLVDYGLGALCSPSSMVEGRLLDSVYLDDYSPCPPLYGTKTVFRKGVDYTAKISSIEVRKSCIGIIVEGTLGIVYFNHLAHYWGSERAVEKYYKVDDEITVNFFETKQWGEDSPAILSFIEKGVRLVPFTAFSYQVGDQVDVHVGPIDGKMSLVWFNGVVCPLFPTIDPLFQARVQSRIYYPGYPLKGIVSRIQEDKPGSRFFEFKIEHKRVDYGLQVGDYPCLIREQYGVLSASIQTEIDGVMKTYCFEIPPTEIPPNFPHFDKTRIPATVRITGFNNLGEPMIQFNTCMKELIAQHEGESLDIKLVHPNDHQSKYRIWVGGESLCGLIDKASLSTLGNLVAGLNGRIVNGELQVGKRGMDVCPVHVGETYPAIILERHDTYCEVSFQERTGLLFGFGNGSEESLDVRVVYAGYGASIVLCVPADAVPLSASGLKPGDRLSLRVLETRGNLIIMGDGLHLGIMSMKDWDWLDGRTVLNHDKSFFVEVSIKKITESELLVLERRPLIEDPWNRISLMEGDEVEVQLERMAGTFVTVSLEGIFTNVTWNDFCPYHVDYGRYLFEPGQKVRMLVKEINKEIRVVSLVYLPVDRVRDDLLFDKASDYSATVIRLLPQGVLVRVNDIYGLIPTKYMMAESLYTKDAQVSVRFIKHAGSSFANYFEFSHIATVDTSRIIKFGNVIPFAKLEKVFDNWLRFLAEDIPVSCNKIYAKYFSKERSMSFVDGMVVGQTYPVRIVDVENRRIVPEGMPDYSSIPVGKEYEGSIDAILEEAYLIHIDELDDSFYVPFAGYCDWGESHIETRKVHDRVKATVASYSEVYNLPNFSLIAGKEDPWTGLSAGDTVKVTNLGSVLQKNDLYVDVRGIPVLLSTKAISVLAGKPWIGNTLDYPSIKGLLGTQEFEMVIVSMDREKHQMELMPHWGTCPELIRKAQVIRRQANGLWVRIRGKLVGYLPNDEIPDGYVVNDMLEQAVCKYSQADGYAFLSVKDLFEKTTEKEPEKQEVQLKGILVTPDTELRENLIVRGVLKNVDMKNNRFFIQVGPYLGTMTFFEQSHLACDVPALVFERDKEYDFSIIRILDNSQGKLLILSRKRILPPPSPGIREGLKVSASVKRYNPKQSIIVAGLDGYEGVEAVIQPHDLEGCEGGRYPKIGFRFTAEISEIEENNGKMVRIKLNKGV